MILVDSNILIYALNSASPKHKQAQQYLTKIEDEICIAQQNVLEVYRAITHPTFIKKVSISFAHKSITDLISGFSVLSPSLQSYALWEQLVSKGKVNGNQVFDAYLVATMLTNGVKTIATDNSKHFEYFPHIMIINPFK